MNDQFTETTTQGWGSRLIGSIKRIFLGILLFFASFGVLYWNEGRVDVSKVAETAIEINADGSVTEEINQQLVSTTGKLSSTENIGDTFLKSGQYLSIFREVEMYAWEEDKKTKKTKKTGGSETTKTTYSYSEKWSSNPQSSQNFKHKEGHINPEMILHGNSQSASIAHLGKYELTGRDLQFPAAETLRLNTENTILSDGFQQVNSEYIFKGFGSLSAPKVGDIRVSYSVVKNPVNTATVFGKVNTNTQQILPYYGKKNTKLYRAFEGTRDGAIATMSSEHTFMTWMLRGAGFLMMWIGLGMLFGPISVFLDVLPILGSIGRGVIGGAMFLVALVLSSVTILVSMILHNIIALVVVLVLFVAGVIWYAKKKKNEQPHINPQG